MVKLCGKEFEDENVFFIMYAWGVLRWNFGDDVVEEYVGCFVDDEI